MTPPSKTSLDYRKLAILAGAYAALSQLTTAGFDDQQLPILAWPGAGVSLALLLLWGTQYWPGILLGAIADALIAGTNPGAALWLGIGKSLSPVLGVWLLRRVSSFSPELIRPADYLWLTAAGAVSTSTSGLAGASSLTFHRQIELSESPGLFISWCLGDTLGIVMIAPFLLVWKTLPEGWWAPQQRLQTVLCFGLSTLAGQAIFMDWLEPYLGPFADSYWMFLFVAWGAMVYGRHGALLICTVTGVQALVGAIGKRGAFATSDLQTTGIINFWFYLFSLTMVGLMFALMIHDRKRGQERLAAAKAAADEARAVAEQANQAKGDFLAIMSHEIRTPLNAILGLSHLTLKTRLTPKQHDYLTKIRGAADSLLKLINDILDASKIEAGKLDIDCVPFNLGMVIDDVFSTVAFKAREKGLELVHYIERGIPRGLVGDAHRLNQVLLNLTNNAVKFTEKGEVVITVHAHAHEQTPESQGAICLRFAVHDTGPGMTEEQVSRLFNAFTQAERSTSRTHGGTGLGLFISKKLVELMGGEISLQSKPGFGSTFSFVLSFPIDANAPAVPSLPRRCHSLRVLVVDDNERVRETLRTEMAAMRLSVTVANSGRAALEELERADREGEAAYDLVLLDQKMPDLDGLETAEKIQKEMSLSKQPVLFLLTGDERDEEKLQDQGHTFKALLMKPLSASALFDNIVSTFGPPQLPKESEGYASPSHHPLAGARILVVEDNPINQQVTRELLEGWGADVVLADGGQQALDVLERAGADFDVALMDLRMPGMDGFEATRRIRSELKIAALPIIAVTADAMERERQQCLAAGMNDHVAKPIVPDTLLATLLLWINPERLGVGSVAKAPSRVEGLPELPGVEINSALARVSGNLGLLRNLLGEFSRGWSDVVERLTVATEEMNWSEALHLAHTLKGLAATLSMAEVSSAAERLERDLKREEFSTVPLLLGDLERAMAVVVPGLAQLQPSSALESRAEPGSEEALNLPTVEQVIAELHDLLRDNDFEASGRLATLQRLLAKDGPWSEALRDLQDDLDRLDFEAARQSLVGLTLVLNCPLTEEH